MEDSKRSKLTAEALEQLQQGVSLEFSRWWALQVAVSDGGEALILEKKKPLFWLLFSVSSPNPRATVAEKLMIMHEECLEGNYQSARRLREVSPIPHVVQASMGGNDDSDGNDLGNNVDGNMMIDSPANNEAAAKDMEVDGWITVSRKKSKGRKK